MGGATVLITGTKKLQDTNGVGILMYCTYFVQGQVLLNSKNGNVQDSEGVATMIHVLKNGQPTALKPLH